MENKLRIKASTPKMIMEDMKRGFSDGMRDCSYGFTVDEYPYHDTDYSLGYDLGWNAAKDADLHGGLKEEYEETQRLRREDLWISPEELDYIKACTATEIPPEVRAEIFGVTD